MGSRRDAVAAVLGNLYIFAGALRSQRKVPVRSHTYYTIHIVSYLLTLCLAVFAQRGCGSEKAHHTDNGSGRANDGKRGLERCKGTKEMGRHIQLLLQRESDWLCDSTRGN